MKFLGTINVVLDITDRLLTKYFVFDRDLRKKWEYDGTIHQLFIDIRKAYDSVKRDVLYRVIYIELTYFFH